MVSKAPDEVVADTNPRRPRFRVGDLVQFPVGSELIVAPIIEDRGNIGHRGQRIYRVEYPPGGYEGEPVSREVTVDRVQPAPEGAVPTK